MNLSNNGKIIKNYLTLYLVAKFLNAFIHLSIIYYNNLIYHTNEITKSITSLQETIALLSITLST